MKILNLKHFQIDGHGDYKNNLDIILKAVGVRTKDELNIPKKGSKGIGELREYSPKPDVVNANGANTPNTGETSDSNSENDKDKSIESIPSNGPLLDDLSTKTADIKTNVSEEANNFKTTEKDNKTTARSETSPHALSAENVMQDNQDDSASAIETQSAINDNIAEKSLNSQGDYETKVQDGHENAGNKTGDVLNSMGFVCMSGEGVTYNKETGNVVVPENVEDDDEEGCYFTDSNPGSEGEDDEEKT